MARALLSERAALIAHVASLLVGVAIVAYLGRNQWFFFDEWDFIWNPTARLWAGHGGHWSTVPILIWMLLQSTFGLSSYWPFFALLIVTHALLAHLLWRLMNRIGVERWISTIIAAVFLVLGAGAENLLWAFQFGFIGAMVLALGALLIVMPTNMTLGRAVAAAVLLLLAAATSGTALPLFIPVVWVIIRMHGWRWMWATVTGPVVIYMAWYLLIAGPNSNASLRATRSEILLVPQFAGTMLVDGLGTIVPLPYFGAVLVAVLLYEATTRLRRPMAASSVAAVSMLAAGVAFALLTGYTRWHTSLGSADSGRYVYYVAAACAPIFGLMLTRLVSRSHRMLAAALLGLSIVVVFNAGLLVQSARAEASRENTVHEVLSAALSIQSEFADQVDGSGKPEPKLLPRTLDELAQLHEREGLPTIPYTDAAYLTALINVGLIVEKPTWAVADADCLIAVPGSILGSDTVLTVDSPGTLRLAAARDGIQGDPRLVDFDPGVYLVRTVDDSDIVVTEGSPYIRVCAPEAEQ